MRVLLVPFVTVAFLVPLAACEKINPVYCCTDLATCHEPGGSEDLIACTDPARPYCDNGGEYGDKRTCIADPGTTACDGPEDCTAPTVPVCDVSGSGTCVGCDVAADCSRFAGMALCETTSGACVECLAAGDCTESNEPVCGADHACRGCGADTECDSGVCDETMGTCVAESSIVYVATTGSGSACTRAQPCATITAGVVAVGGARQTILVAAGVYTETVIIDDKTATIVGVDATLQPAALNQVPLSVINQSNVTIERLRVTGSGGGASPEGINCQGQAGNPATVALIAATVDANGGPGINANRCDLTVNASMVAGNTGAGVLVATGGLTIDASRIIDNNGGGIVTTSGGTVAVRNSFIAKNGDPSSLTGGVNLGGPTSLVFEFNTVADSVTANGFAAGVQCTSGAMRTLANNIIVGPAAVQVSATNCNFTYTLSNQTLTGTGNATTAPTFINAATNDYHLAPGSAGINGADPAATLLVDIDGQARPQGGRSDIGADEAQ